MAWTKIKLDTTWNSTVPTKIPPFSLFPFLVQWAKEKKNSLIDPIWKRNREQRPHVWNRIWSSCYYILSILALCRCWGSSTWDSYILVGTILLILEPPFQFGCGFFTSLTFSPYLFYLARSCKRKRFRNPMPSPYIPIVWFFLLYPFWR